MHQRKELSGLNRCRMSASFIIRNAADGCYEVDVTSVVKAGLTFDGSEPVNGFQKGIDATPDADCRSGGTVCGAGSTTSSSNGQGPAARLRAAINIKRRHEAELFGIAGVVGVGVGRREDGSPTIEVYLDAENAVARRQIPRQIEGVLLRAKVTGSFVAY